MAMNLEWIIEELYPNEKVIISAANVHVSKVQYNQYGYMGKLLHQKYQSDYYSIGLFHSLGNPTHLMRDYFYENKNFTLNAYLLSSNIDELNIDNEIFTLINNIASKKDFTHRQYYNLIKLSLTISDLEESNITHAHVYEALTYIDCIQHFVKVV